MIARTYALAKLNLFLELIAKRPDGYHDIDTVMVPIDWSDSIELERIDEPTVQLDLEWLPSRSIVCRRLGGAGNESGIGTSITDVPTDQRNLVVRALNEFRSRFSISHGLRCRLLKQIPPGAGMGGASSDAAAALLAAAHLTGMDASMPELLTLAAGIGSDVPFFMGQPDFDADQNHSNTSGHKPARVPSRCGAARATGRGERIDRIATRLPLNVVVVYPARLLSTPRVYGQSRVPEAPVLAQKLILALESGRRRAMVDTMVNRLTKPAIELEPVVSEVLGMLGDLGLQGCQMTGSGSACFGIASTARHARRVTRILTSRLEPGAIIRACQTRIVPPIITIEDR